MALPLSTSPLTYNGWVQAIGAFAVVDTTTAGGVTTFNDVRLQALALQILNFAELSIQRDADLNALQTASSAYAMTAGNNVFSLPLTDWVTVQTLMVNGAPLLPVSKEFLQNVYGSNAVLAQPLYFASYGGDQASAGNTSTEFILGPWPDQNYTVTVTGTQRLPSLGLGNTAPNAATATTYISTWLPDALIAASMIMVSAEQRDWSPMGNDPQAPINWTVAYQGIMQGVRADEARKNFEDSAWTSNAQPTLATPGR